MGFFGKLWKGVKNIFSGIGNFVKSAVSGKNWWKTAIVGATAYFGGAALGYWKSPVVSSINGAWAGDIQDGGGRKGGWFGEMFGANRNDTRAETFGLGEDEPPMAEEWLGGSGATAPSPSIGNPSGGLMEYNADNYRDINGNYDDMPPVPRGSSAFAGQIGDRVNDPASGGAKTFALGERKPLLGAEKTPLVNLATGAPPPPNQSSEGLLSSAWETTKGAAGAVSDWTAKHDRVAAVGLSALGGAFEDKQQDAYETAQGTLQANQDMNKIGGVPKGSRFGAKATASARQTKPSSEAEMEKLRQSMTPQQWAEYVKQMELEGQKTPSRVV
jgi:hypothetical protein